MITTQSSVRGRLVRVARQAARVLPPVPQPLLAPMQPLLRRLLLHILQQRSELRDRMGDKVDRCIRIDARGLPFSLLLRLDPQQPMLRAVPQNSLVPSDARIGGNILTLMDMVDGELDGDALFFARSISIDGDTEAVVRLRNALDDLDGSVLDNVADFFGVPGRLVLQHLRDQRQNSAEEVQP